MTRQVLVWLFLGLLFVADGKLACAETWKLVWSDEFDQAGAPDPSRWTYEEGFIRNHELQFYTRRAENARVEDGMLVIEARREKFPNPRFQSADARDWKKSREHAEYTSASVTTRGIADWRYGRVEVRAKLPGGRGMWPAIWMLGSNRSLGWPACGEIDIMEYVGYEPETIHGTVHTAKYNHVKGTHKGDTIQIAGPDKQFHIYAIEWDKDKIAFFVDGRQYFTFENEQTGNDAWPFDQPHYLILNTAVGGSWGGKKGIDETIFPTRFEIDYVRVYQR
jgi:beta-glucanase (GH16 family)